MIILRKHNRSRLPIPFGHTSERFLLDLDGPDSAAISALERKGLIQRVPFARSNIFNFALMLLAYVFFIAVGLFLLPPLVAPATTDVDSFEQVRISNLFLLGMAASAAILLLVRKNLSTSKRMEFETTWLFRKIREIGISVLENKTDEAG